MEYFDEELLLSSLKGWLRSDQLENIRAAIRDGRFDVKEYNSLSATYVMEKFDNGGFTPREQYALRFANS